MALGNPLGLSSSFTEGIVSALNRQEPEGNGVVLPSAIQTSAAINPGNSGGALVDIQGRVIGIPTLAAADPQMGGAAAGIGFAIPSNVVTNIASQLVEERQGHELEPRLPRRQDRRHRRGDRRLRDAGAPGHAGREGRPEDRRPDHVAQRHEDADSSTLGTVLAGLKPGQTVKVTVAHQSGTTETVNLTLGEFSS